MIGEKYLNIAECCFSLPNEFDGTLGDALMLLAQYRLECEKAQKITTTDDLSIDGYEELAKRNNDKCYIKYELFGV